MDYYLQKLKQSGLKITPKRKAILALLSGGGRFLSPQNITSQLKKKFKKVSTPSVYRNLEEMYNIEMLVKIQKSDRRLYYALCKVKEDIHHHHIICIKCGKVGEVRTCDLFKTKKIDGFKIVDHHVQLDGLCKECK